MVICHYGHKEKNEKINSKIDQTDINKPNGQLRSSRFNYGQIYA